MRTNTKITVHGAEITPSEKEGVRMIIALMRADSRTETEEQALLCWRRMFTGERYEVLRAYSAVLGRA